MRNPGLIKNFIAGGAIGAYRIAKFGASDTAALQASAATDALLGVCIQPDGAAQGDRVDICLSGVTEVEFGDDVTRGALLTSDADGRAVPVTRHTHTENTAGAYAQNATTGAATAGRVLGVAMCSGAAGDIGSVHILPSLA